LERNGFVFRRNNGSHRIYFNSETKKLIVVPVHGKKDLPIGTFMAILRQAGLNKTNY
jgi:predicted RNA binding protein YcfA (HicA-like mRNA interferase family)